MLFVNKPEKVIKNASGTKRYKKVNRALNIEGKPIVIIHKSFETCSKTNEFV